MHDQPQTSLSSHEVILSLPQPSLAPSLFANPSTDAGSATDSLDLLSNVQNLIAHEVRPIRYGPTVETSQGTSDMLRVFHNPWRDTRVRQINRTKINNPMRCEVCEIGFNSRRVFEDHMSGKKHRKKMQLHNNPSNTIFSGTSNVNFQIQDSSVQGHEEPFVDAGKDLMSKKRKLLSRGEAEHDDQVDLTSNNNGIGQKKIKVVQPTRCEICMINCNTKDVHITHLSGKKHLRNLKKLSESKSDGAGADAGRTAATVTENDKQPASSPALELQEKPDTNKLECISSYQPENVVISEASEKDTERKKRNHEGGTFITSTKFCTLSNVNNETVFNFPDGTARCEICMIDCNSKPVYISHLSGKRHKRNLEKASKSKNDGAGASVNNAVAAFTTTIDMQQATNQAIEPQEKLETSPLEGTDAHKSGNLVMLEAPEKDKDKET